MILVSAEWRRVSVTEWVHESGLFLLLEDGRWQLYEPDGSRMGAAFWSRFQAMRATEGVH